jgi:hypothetical protein
MSVNIPQGVLSLPEGVFKSCLIIHEITIPSSVTTIGDSVFEGCFELYSITFEGNPTITIDTFGPHDGNLTQWIGGNLYSLYTGSGGGAGTYTRPAEVLSDVWTKVP